MKTRKRLSQHPAAVKSRKRRKRYRLEILIAIGGVFPKCKNCGGRWKLQPHHIKPREWKSRERWALSRLLIYRREARAGLLELLCAGCNKKAGQPNGEDDF
jgi:5-methylcytosine-specific restriction endonuclease McrA